MLASDVVAVLLVVANGLLIFVSLAFLVSGLDDLFIDLCYFVRSGYRKLFVTPRHPRITEAQLQQHPEAPLAIMIPAWQESEVIGHMLGNTLRTLNYNNYRIFVGAYPNDAATQHEVQKVADRNDRVELVCCPHDGPTNKADCLNWVYQGIRRHERQHGIEFQIFVMQDCEDIVHPLAYKLINFLIPRKDMVQLPVFSLLPKWYQLTAGHYIDEFSQLHYKDLVVRELLCGSIPAAGVGCAFSRRAFQTVAGDNHNELFSTDSLTEDYDFGLRLKKHNLKQVFVKFPVSRVVTRNSFWSGKPRQVVVDDYVCIREYFPARFWAAVRQKSRWVVGITLQGWEHLGWRGNLWMRYMLFRDRKSLITNLVNILGYLIVPVVLGVWLANQIDPDAYRYPSILERGSWLWYVLLGNAGLLVARVLLRAYCTFRLYGITQALLSTPRMVWGNVINFCATCRAIKQYLRYLRTGKLIAWDKTSHVYPSEAELGHYRRKLGDLLLERRLITADQLNEALQQQKGIARRLGEILTEMGALGENDLELALQHQ